MGRAGEFNRGRRGAGRAGSDVPATRQGSKCEAVV